MEFNLIVAGVGGQGSILASHIIAEAAIQAGAGKYSVRVGETFGAAQRGGAVASHVRFGENVYGPLVGGGRAGLVLALEPLEGLRVGLPYLAPTGEAILNTDPKRPVDVNIGAVDYPLMGDIEAALASVCKKVVAFNALALAVKAGSAKALSVVMLGAASASGLFFFGEDVMLEAIKTRVPQKMVDVNITAFNLGRRAYLDASK
jgi:indolepyruvate ferredoxin oxidoreductase beta subunit